MIPAGTSKSTRGSRGKQVGEGPVVPSLEEDKVVSAARDIFFVNDRPLRAGQYGNFAIHQTTAGRYSTAGAAHYSKQTSQIWQGHQGDFA